MLAIVLTCSTCLLSSGIISALLFFLLMGSIPGTNYALSPDMMLGILVGILSLLLAQSVVRFGRTIAGRRMLQSLNKQAAQLPHRRYARRATQS
jgi:hypothetical protein